MSNPSKRKGTWLENAAVAALRTRWPSAERRAQRGIHDAGDVAGVPLTVECKYGARVSMAGGWREAVREARENGHRPPIVVAKRKGSAKPMEQWVITDMDSFLRLLS